MNGRTKENYYISHGPMDDDFFYCYYYYYYVWFLLFVCTERKIIIIIFFSVLLFGVRELDLTFPFGFVLGFGGRHHCWCYLILYIICGRRTGLQNITHMRMRADDDFVCFRFIILAGITFRASLAHSRFVQSRTGSKLIIMCLTLYLFFFLSLF